MTTNMLDDILAAENANHQGKGCQACSILAQIEDPELKAGLERALAGTIGTETLSKILARHGYSLSRRQINNHRNEARS